MKIPRLLAVGLFSFLVVTVCSAQGNDIHLSDPTRTMYVPNHIVEGNNTWNHWYWDGSHLIAFRRFAGGKIPEVQVYDQNGFLQREANIWFDNAKTVTITSVAVGREGRLFVAGGTVSESGQIAQFIGEVNGRGVLARVVRTTPYIPWHLCSTGDDDTVWAYGFERQAGTEAPYDHAVLRHYSMSRGLLEGVLNRSALPSAHFPIDGWYPGQTNMRCTSTRIGIYNGPTDQLITYDLAKRGLNIVNVEPLAKEMVWTGFAMTDDGNVFASFDRQGRAQPRQSGLYRLQVGPDHAAQWVAVAGTVGAIGAANSRFSRLAGSDGNLLVYSDDRRTSRLLFADITQ
jgi:hypothetical protein